MALGAGWGLHSGLPFPALLLLVFGVGLLWPVILPTAQSPESNAESSRPAPSDILRSPHWGRSVGVLWTCLALWWLPVAPAAVGRVP